MAVGFDPRKVYRLSLDCFESVPDAEKPYFFYRRINGAEWNDIASVKSLEGQSFTEQGEAIYNALKIGLTGWERQIDPATDQSVEFDPEKLSSVLDPLEAMELVNKRLFSARLNGTERKN